ncbi:MFS transporter [Tersicoccus phoenicis]|uniref:MFS transporter n=1 Tax=Tersicoccus phoenicis TaxID=554083 RepID=A0A1R1LNB3_9MICC|nr:MFS transporter [Tersicoccus phoenicis]OMH29025.1 MFS transporter [Tersicoccus phoenicis]
MTARNEWTVPTRRPAPFTVLCAVGFLGRLSYEMARTPLTPLYAQHLGSPVQVIGFIVGSVTITGIVVKLPAGALSDLFGFRRLMLAGSLVKATGPFFYLLAFTWPGLLIVRFYHGLATALYAPPASALVAKAYPHARGSRLGIYNAAENAGVVLGPVLGGTVLAVTMSDFGGSFVICGAVGLLALAAMLRLPDDEISSAPPRESGAPAGIAAGLRTLARGVREIVADPAIRLVSLVEAVLWIGIGSLQAYLPIYGVGVGLSVWQIGLLAGGQGVASVVSRPLMGRYSDRLPTRVPLIVAGVALCVVTLIAIPYTGDFLLLLLFSVIFGLGTGIVTPSTMAMIGDLVTRGNYGSAMGVFGSLWDAGHALGPVLLGLLVAWLGYRTSWLVMALVMLAALVVFLSGTARLRARHHPDRRRREKNS